MSPGAWRAVLGALGAGLVAFSEASLPTDLGGWAPMLQHWALLMAGFAGGAGFVRRPGDMPDLEPHDDDLHYPELIPPGHELYLKSKEKE